MSAPSGEDLAAGAAVVHAARAAAACLVAFEHAERHLHPPDLPALRAGFSPIEDGLREGRIRLAATKRPDDLAPLFAHVDGALRTALEGVELFVAAPGAAPDPAPLLGALRKACRVREALYPLRRSTPWLGRCFAEAPLAGSLELLDPEPVPEAARGRVGSRVAALDGPDARGGFVLSVPESWDGVRALPLIVALHGAFGFGQDFVWTWLREARSRGCLLLAPTSPEASWSLQAPARDGARLFSMVEHVRARWPVDPAHVLLTGLSDGATFAFLCGLAEASPFTHLAPVSGVLPPAALAPGRLARLPGTPVYLVHGARDWMFPVALARAARDALGQAGAAVVYREIADLSHTYPREENARILRWMDPRLALAGEGADEG